MIIETLYASLRQSQAIVRGGSKEWHISTRMDDVDYLIEDNAMDDFAYHRKWMGPMVGPLLKMILNSSYWGARWKQNANAGNDSGNWE